MKRFFSLLIISICITSATPQPLSEAEVTTYMNRAFTLLQSKDYKEALTAFNIVESNTQPNKSLLDYQVHYTSKSMSCLCLQKLQKYKEAYEKAKLALQGNLSESERKDFEQLYVHNGYLYAKELCRSETSDRDDYASAREILQEILIFSEGKIKNQIQQYIPITWYYEATAHQYSERYEEALQCYINSYEGFHLIGNKNFKLSALMNIAYIHFISNNKEEAQKHYLEALLLARETNNEASEMEILIELSNLSISAEDWKSAHTYEAKMDELYKTSTNQITNFNYMICKGELARAQEKYDLAEQWFLKAAEIADLPAYANHSYSYTVYIKLRDLLTIAERYDDALNYADKVLKEGRKGLSPNDAGYYSPYFGIIEIQKRAGNQIESLKAVDSLFCCEPLYREPRQVARLYTTRARCHRTFKNYELALQDYLKADELLATTYPPEDAERVLLLSLLGGITHQLGLYKESENYYKKHEKAIVKFHGEGSLPHLVAKINLANAEGFAGHIKGGCRDYSESCNLLKSKLKLQWPLMISSERQKYWNNLSDFFTLMTPYALEANRTNDSFTLDCYNALMMSKGFLLDSERTLADIVKSHGTSTDKDDYMQLSLMHSQIKTWENNYEENADSILSLSIKADQLARSLLQRLNTVGNQTNFMDVDFERVKEELGANDVVIDFTDFITKAGERKYAAYIVTKEQKYPLLVPLFSESQIDSLSIIRPDMYYYEENSKVLLKLLWEPLKEHIAKGATVYYVPSQILFQVSLESLALSDGTLLGNHYQFIRLSSAREIVKMKQNYLEPLPKTAVLYGGLHYDISVPTMKEEAQKYNIGDWYVMRGNNVRGDSIFHELKNTQIEVERIDSILSSVQWEVTTRMKHEGTEESFLSMHGNSPRYLQVATHGFYYTPNEAQKVNYLKGYSDAMQLSGLVLSGGNAAWKGEKLPQGILGGILTAETISRLDLSKTEMAVLSACQSGQGQASSEGLYGLQRAFKKAGVSTLVMTLWNLEDNKAREFMITFYEQLAKKENGWDKRKAFEATKEIFRNNNPKPYHWAAFIMVD